MEMKFLSAILFFAFVAFVLSGYAYSQPLSYQWLDEYENSQAIASRIQIPDGYRRIEVEPVSFAYWLRHLPLKEGRPSGYLYDGGEKSNQSAHFAVVDIDVGGKNLQQCADAVIRLRAEYLYSIGDSERIHFNFTSGDRANYAQWAQGYRPVVNGNSVRWIKSGVEEHSYDNFKRYLERVFIYAGSYSLSAELQDVQDVKEMKIGDVFIVGGFPGHAVIVVDMAVNEGTGEKLFLLAQSYMPAQDIHILKNPTNPVLSPWYEQGFGEVLNTPEWTFRKSNLKRF